MKFTKWAFIYLGAGGENPESDRAVIEHGGLTTTIVAVPDLSTAVETAVELADDGAQTIELCGAFGPTWTTRVIEALEGRIPVGSVGYGMESVPKLAALFAPETDRGTAASKGET